MVDGRKCKAELPAIIAAGVVLFSGTAMAQPMLDLTVNNTAGGSQTFSGAAIGPGISDLSASGTLGGYEFELAATATDGNGLDELFEVSINTSVVQSPAGRLEFDLVGSGYTGFSGPTQAGSEVTPSSVDGDLDVETSVGGTTVLDAEDLSTSVDASDSRLVSLTSPYSIRHFSEVEQGSLGDTTTFDTTTAVPAPATIGLLGAGLLGLGIAARRRVDT